MFERFTERARNVMVLAQEEARHMRHDYIGTEHLLLGLLKEDEGVAARALRAVNVSLDVAREQVQNIVGYGEEETGGQVPFTPRSKKILELSLKEALQIGHNYIGTEHILLGLVRDSEGVAARTLSNLDVDADDVRREVVRMLGGGARPDPFDQVEAEMEAEEASGRRAERRMLFKGRINSIKVETASMGAFTVSLDYTYAKSNTADSSEVVETAELISHVRSVFEGQELSTVEDGISAVGMPLFGQYPKLREITVSAAHWIEAGESGDYEVTTSATFRR